jgi:arylsulfatase A-like enzyme
VARPVRYTFILALALLATVLAAVGGWQFARASAPVSGPIVLVSIESLRADRLPAYGYRSGDTPAIDALAADGIVFDRAYANAAQTLPSHATLLTGRLPFQTGVRDDVGFRLGDDEPALAELLSERDFATGGVVSSFLLRPSTGIARGFEFYDAAVPGEPAAGPLDRIERDGAESEAIAEHWLASQDSSRVFLFLQLNEPQAPYRPPERFADLDPYDGEVAYADEILGRLVHWLKAHQLYDRSTIIVVSDHGEGLGDHGELEHGLLVYQEDIRVPLIVKPAGGGGGRRVDGVVQLADLAPTILDLAKAPVPWSIAGRSLDGVLQGDAELPARFIYSEAAYGQTFFGWPPIVSLTDGTRQYIRGDGEEYYALDADPRERTDVAADADLAPVRRALDALVDHAPAPLADARLEDPDPRFAAALGSTRLPAGERTADAPAPRVRTAIVEHYRAAIAQAADGLWPAALDGLDRLLRADPDQPNVWHDLAEIAAQAGQVDRAAAALARMSALGEPAVHTAGQQ